MKDTAETPDFLANLIDDIEQSLDVVERLEHGLDAMQQRAASTAAADGQVKLRSS